MVFALPSPLPKRVLKPNHPQSTILRSSSQATMKPSTDHQPTSLDFKTNDQLDLSHESFQSKDSQLNLKDDDGVDDGYVETTSLTAAKALALEHIPQTDIQDDSKSLFDRQLIQISSRDWNGKTVYRVR